jgi:hypothetical protein
MANRKKEITSMARTGKIARLPRDIRSQLNTRLQDGQGGKQIVLWLNSLPQVKEVLAAKFDGRPVNEQNLSDWRLGGYQEWLAHNDILAQVGELADNRDELQAVAPGQSLADHLTAAITFRFAAILAAQGQQFDEPARGQLRLLTRLCQAAVKLRRSDQNAARLKIETERWEMARTQMAEEWAETTLRKQRDALAAPIWAAVKSGERAVEFGGGKAARFAAEMLREIETCDDPVHFYANSKVLAAQSPEEWRRYAQEWAKHPPVQKTPAQAAIEMIEEFDAYLESKESKSKAATSPSPSKSSRRSKRPAKRRPTTPRPPPASVPSVHKVHNVHPVHQQATPPTQSNPDQSIPPGPTPPQPVPSSPIKVNQGVFLSLPAVKGEE